MPPDRGQLKPAAARGPKSGPAASAMTRLPYVSRALMRPTVPSNTHWLTPSAGPRWRFTSSSAMTISFPDIELRDRVLPFVPGAVLHLDDAQQFLEALGLGVAPALGTLLHPLGLGLEPLRHLLQQRREADGAVGLHSTVLRTSSSVPSQASSSAGTAMQCRAACASQARSWLKVMRRISSLAQ